MRLLVTGGLGHIGSRLIREYASRKDIECITILDNLSTQRYCSLFNLPASANYRFVEGDVNDVNAVREALKGMDVVIHLAAITDAPSTISHPETTFHVNLKGTELVLSEAGKHGVKKFLFPSTTSVYGEAEGVVDEGFTDYKPASPYASSKLEAEKIVIAAGSSNAHGKLNGQMKVNVLRLGTIFGTSIGMRFHTAVNKFIYLAAMGKPITVWENALSHKRPYLGLSDAIDAFEFMEKNGKNGEIYNVLTGNFTVSEIVDALRAFFPRLEIAITKSPILNQKSYCVSDTKIRALGFTPSDVLADSIKEYVEMFRGIGNAR